MNIDYSIWISPHKIRTQDTHVPRQHDQIDVVLVNQFQDMQLSYLLDWYYDLPHGEVYQHFLPFARMYYLFLL